jgi:hypothetical protein
MANGAVYRSNEGVIHLKNVIHYHGSSTNVILLTSHKKSRATLRRFLRNSKVRNIIADLSRHPVQNFTPIGRYLFQVWAEIHLRRYVK